MKQLVSNQKLLLILATGTIFSAQASFLHNALKGLTAAVALKQAYGYAQVTYKADDMVASSFKSISQKPHHLIFFDAEKQALLHDLIKPTAVPFAKPVYFGVDFGGAKVHHYQEADCIVLDDRIFPLPDGGTIADDEATFKAMDLQEFKKCVEDDLGTIQHEVGHIQLNHDQKTRDYLAKIWRRVGLAGVSFTGYFLTKALLAPSKQATLGNYLALLTMTPVIMKVVVPYLITRLGQSHEYQADAYAIEHCNAQQLENHIAHLLKHYDNDEVLKKKYGISEEKYGSFIFAVLKKIIQPFRTHPPTEERIAILDAAIAAKQREIS